MKTIILAGGNGLRGRPFTKYVPKAMIPVLDVPLIERIVCYLDSFKIIDEIIIIADYNGIGNQLKHHAESLDISTKITFVQDSNSGTAGDLIHVQNIDMKEDFMLWFVDNLCAIDINDMLESYKKQDCLACITTRNERKEETGFAVVVNGVVKKFIEKPILDLPMQECLGIYILNGQVLRLIKEKNKPSTNLSFDIFEDLAKQNQICAYNIKIPWLDIESPTIINRNLDLTREIIKMMESKSSFQTL